MQCSACQPHLPAVGRLTRAGRLVRASPFAPGQAREVSLTPRWSDGEVGYGPQRNGKPTANVNRVQRLLSALAASRPFGSLAMITLCLMHSQLRILPGSRDPPLDQKLIKLS